MPKPPPPLVEVGPPRPRNAILIHDDDDRSGGLGRDSRTVVGTGGQGGRRAEGDRFGGSERGRGRSSAGGHAARHSPLAPSSPAVARAPTPHEVVELDDDDDDSGSERPEKVAPRVESQRLVKEEPLEHSGSDSEEARARARARVVASALGGSRKSSKRRREAKPHKAGGRGDPGGSGKQSIRRGRGRPRLHYSNDESSGAPRKKLKSAGCRRHDHKGGDRGRHDAAPARQVGAVAASRTRSPKDDRRKVAAKYPASVGSDESGGDDYPPCFNHRSGGSPAKVKSAGCRRHGHKGGSSDWRGSAPARQVGAAVSSRTRSRNGDDRRKVASAAKNSTHVEEVSSDDNGESQRGNREEEDVVKGKNKVDDNGDNSEDMYKSVEEEEDGNGVHDDSYAGVDEEDNDDTTEPQEEEEGAEEEEEEEESHEAGEEPRRTPSSNAKAGGSARPGGDGTPPIRKKKFEGLCLVDKADTTSAGEGIRKRTRSQRSCSDKKLLSRGTFSKPYCIEVSESEPEEEVPSPAQTENVQPPGSAFEDDSGDDDDDDIAPTKKRRRRRQDFHSDDSGSESDRTFAMNAKKGPSSGRPKNGGAPYRQQQQTAKEGCSKVYAGCSNSNPQRVKNYYAGNPADPQMQGDVTFKKSSLLPHKGGKRWKNSQEKKAYDDLFDSIFDEIEKHHPNGSAPAQAQQDNTQHHPLIFSFGDEDEVEEEKSEFEKTLDEVWGDYDLILEGMNDSKSTKEEGEEGNAKKNPINKATLCEDGKEHDFFQDDQIGIVCRHCRWIQTEIRHVFPPMGNWSEEESDPREDRELDRYIDEFNEMLKANGIEEECCIVGHRSGPVWDLVPGVREDMFPHQREAFEFMWNKLAGGTDIEQVRKNVKSDGLSGCFISHAPGTGKTRLATTLVQSYLELFPRCSPVIIAPKVMLATWEQEFRKWNAKVPLHVLNSTHICWDGDKTIQRLAENDDDLAQKLLDYEFRRDVMLLSWCEGNSVIGLSYKLFTKFTKEEEGEDDDDDDDHDDTRRDREKMRQLRKALLQRPDLLVLDEGHIPRNRDSQIWKCLAQVRTEKRIFLSGTPFQNNFEELRNSLCLLRGNVDSKLPGKDEDKGFWASLTVDNVVADDGRVNEVRAKLEPFLHIHNGDILHKSLPGLRESVVILNPLPMQKKIVAAMEKGETQCSLELEYKISLASVHPSLITCMKNVSDEVASIVDQPSLERIRLKPCVGVKARFVYEIVRRCYRSKERVLVFSQYLETLDLIREQLSRKFHWTKDREILQMSGKVKVETRQSLMMAFNDMKSDAKVMLASTKACGEGIQLIGASRVVLLDVVWNPSVGKQAIGRAYRIGQQKVVHTYNLITEGTKEKSKFERQAKKDHMSKLLFSNESQPAQCNQSPELIFSDSILEDMTEDENLKEMFVNILPSQ